MIDGTLPREERNSITLELSEIGIIFLKIVL